MPRIAKTIERMDKIVSLLKASPGPMTAAELGDCMGIRPNLISALCSQLRGEGRIIRADAGGRRQKALWTVEKTNGEGQKEDVNGEVNSGVGAGTPFEGKNEGGNADD